MILIIDNYDSFTYNLYQMVAALHEEVIVLRNDAMTLEEVIASKPSGIILSPGPGRPEEAGICIALLQHLISTSATIPLLGVCLGHQALGYALGGKIISAPEIVHGKGTFVFHHRKDFYQQLPLPFQAGRYHSLMVDRGSLPQELIVDAENSEGIIMGMHHKNLPLYGVQFHPESILTPHGRLLLDGFVQQCIKL